MRSIWLGLLCAFGLGGCADTPDPAPIGESGVAAPGAKVSKPKPPLPAPPGYYRVRAGDSLYKIAFEHDLEYRRLAALNDLQEPYVIKPGQLLRLPGPVPAEGAAATVPDGGWVWPARGKVIADFEPGRGRKGLDIAGARDAPIRAALSGTVVYAGSSLRGYGKLTIIQHGPTLLTAYGHQATARVAEGQRVAAGQVIGGMGDSDTDRVKLHFEVREFGKPVDPRLFLPRQD